MELITLSDFNTYYKPTIIYGLYGIRIDIKINGTQQESPEIDPHIHIQLIFDKGANVTEWKKTCLLTTADSSNKWCSNIWTSIWKNNPYLINTKINLNWFRGLNVCTETIKLLKENKISVSSLRQVFLGHKKHEP